MKHFFKKTFVVENVRAYYQFLINPSFNIGRHYFWASDNVSFFHADISRKTRIKNREGYTKTEAVRLASDFGFDLKKINLKGNKLCQALRNCVYPETGKYIFERLNYFEE